MAKTSVRMDPLIGRTENKPTLANTRMTAYALSADGGWCVNVRT